VIVEAVWSS